MPIPEDQLATLITNAAAAGELPDVVLANNMADSQAYAAQDVYDADAAQAVIDSSARTRSRPRRSSS